MHQVAEDVWHIPLAPRNAVNAYLLGDVVVDAGTKGMAKRVLKAVAGRGVTAHAITHAHPDHVGGSRAVVDALSVPFWAPVGDAEAAGAGEPARADSPWRGVLSMGSRFAAVTAERELRQDDEVGAGFVVLDSPGHSPGHVSFWRERDRVLVCGDVFFNLRFRGLRPGLRHPPVPLTVDPGLNHASQRKLAELRPELVLFGHGPPLRDPAALARFAGA